MKLKLIYISMLCMLTLTTHSIAAEKSVLFIGNSFTKNKGLPERVSELAKANGKAIHVEMCAFKRPVKLKH